MKTITITEEAYHRLKAWKSKQLDSFSKVILAKIPKKGTLADLGLQMEKLKPLSEAETRRIEQTCAWANDWKNQRDPWTT
jgi:predicted CopG family antitoxin